MNLPASSGQGSRCADRGLPCTHAGPQRRSDGHRGGASRHATGPLPTLPPREADRDDSGFLDRWGDRISRFRAWYTQQPRKTRVPVAAIGIMAGINLLTTGLSDIWFVYPSIPLAAYLLFQHLTAPSKRA